MSRQILVHRRISSDSAVVRIAVAAVLAMVPVLYELGDQIHSDFVAYTKREEQKSDFRRFG